jgi:large subunit ribosomal protein L3
MTPYGKKILADVIMNSPSRFFKKKQRIPEVENYDEQLAALRAVLDQAVEIRAKIHTQPDLTGIGTKKPEILEIKIGGSDFGEIVDWAAERMGQELQIEDFTKPGEFVDVIGITKAHGFTGTVKRHGHTKLPRKTKDGTRRVGSIGPWTPARVRWTVPRYGQFGFFRRTEYNKKVMKIGVEGSDITPSGGFIKYGVVKNRYLVVKGSIPGPKKRLVVLRDGMRNQNKAIREPNLSFISQRSHR